MTVAARLAELGISLPEPAKAVANYVPFVQTGNLVHISGQLSNDAAGDRRHPAMVSASGCGGDRQLTSRSYSARCDSD